MTDFQKVKLIGAIIISALVILAYGFVLIFWMQRVPGAPANETLAQMVGALTASFVAVVQFWIGNAVDMLKGHKEP